ncbi:hypothetical protein GOP47_0024727 [Adiantum capillus-veneris]|uniref:Uncharacterized protein n=1 Tax=Adiantum capillus-veneris TaxID=13818 RepID=A0A9D4Z4L8_ADICA|nr:hypothetical protein GOP47_0024727 [Adiantum capillus-veneris]
MSARARASSDKFCTSALRKIEKLSIAECKIYRKKHKMLDTSGDFFQRAGVDEELCYMRDIMEEEIQEDVNSQLEKWQYAITLLVKIRYVRGDMGLAPDLAQPHGKFTEGSQRGAKSVTDKGRTEASKDMDLSEVLGEEQRRKTESVLLVTRECFRRLRWWVGGHQDATGIG